MMETALDETMAQLDTLLRLQAEYLNDFVLPSDSKDVRKILTTDKIVSPLCVEGLHLIGNSAAILRHYFRLGVRYITLTYNCNNRYGDSALLESPPGESSIGTPYWNGISPAGTEIVREMNRLGLIVDLSHSSADTSRQVLSGRDNWSGSLAPVIFSHSNAAALCPHPRNVPDDVLHLLKKNNGVIMVVFQSAFVSCKTPSNPSETDGLPETVPENATVAGVVRHVKYIGDLIGYDHVGVGSDFDGIFGPVRGLEDVSKFPNLVIEMLKNNISETDVVKIISTNLLRVWSDVEAVAAELQKGGVLKPLEDDIPWKPRPGQPVVQ